MTSEPLSLGAAAPDFSLQDQHGQTISRADLLGAPAVLVFYPYAFSGICSSELGQLQTSMPDFTAAGTRVLAISVDTIFALRTFADQLGLGFSLLSDFWPHGAVARAFGVFDEERGCAVRGSFVLDADGVVRWSVCNEIGAARDIGEHLRAVSS
ncbi:peroxiredoxin [Microlunatus soli]|uniref:Alkyl hydroperoxide reductase E n=1 Tax=Microlunatus soli TaxID=630515 RepID=A0A1H1Z5H6_9ACTN|nr:peroxiredoxin [Microlunatus soli]SDT29075.1 Peroxiredoxin [Microlunatus soli]